MILTECHGGGERHMSDMWGSRHLLVARPRVYPMVETLAGVAT